MEFTIEIESTMHSFRIPHTPIRSLHLDLRRFSRDAAIVASVVLLAALATAGESNVVHRPDAVVAKESARAGDVPLGVEVRVGTEGASGVVRGVDTSAFNAVSLVNEHDESIATAPITGVELRFEDVPAGRYRIVVSSEGPIIQVEGSAISSAIVVRSDTFEMLKPGPIVVESR